MNHQFNFHFFQSPVCRALLLLLFLCQGLSAQTPPPPAVPCFQTLNGFQALFAPANWTATLGSSSSVNTSGAPASVSLSADAPFSTGATYTSPPLPFQGTVSFHYSGDCQSSPNSEFGYFNNGVYTKLVPNSMGGCPFSGDVSFFIGQGQQFAFKAFTPGVSNGITAFITNLQYVGQGAFLTFYQDFDGDGFGNPDISSLDCVPPAEFTWVLNDDDCVDTNAAIKPGATEVCNGVDDDCDAQIDENALPLLNVNNIPCSSFPGISTAASAGSCNTAVTFAVTANPCTGASGTVNHPLAGTNGFAGVMFDVVNLGTSAITITNFSPNLPTGTRTYNVYYTTGLSSWQTVPSNSSAWTLLGSNTVTSTTTTQGTPLNIGGLVLSSGQSKGIYIQCNFNGWGISYFNASRSFDDGVLRVSASPGAGKGFGFTGPTFSNRSYEGGVSYQVNAVSPTIIQTAGLASGAIFPVGTTLNTFTATTSYGTSASCSFNVTVTSNGVEICNGVDDDCNGTPDDGYDLCNSFIVPVTDLWFFGSSWSSGCGAFWNTACGAPANGRESISQFTASASGVYLLHISDAVGTAHYYFKPASGGCSLTGWTCVGVASAAGQHLEFGPLTAGQSYFLMSDHLGETGSSDFHQWSLAPKPDCGSAQVVTCGEAVSFQYNIPAQAGAWFIPGCGSLPPHGVERFFSFTPTETANYFLESMDGGHTLNYFIKAASLGCNPNGWTCVGVIPSSSTLLPLGSLTAGTAYYILADIQFAGNANFQRNFRITKNLTFYRDFDNDSFGNPNNFISGVCAPPIGYVANNTDCNDGLASIYPGATEVCNGLDDDCDGMTDEGVQPTIWYADTDADGFGNPAVSFTFCTQPTGYVANSSDCNDGNAAIKPGATELCNGLDDDCDGLTDEGVSSTTWYADADGDTFGNPAVSQASCTQPTGYVANSSDCNDANPAIKPGATELCNGVDDNCNGQIDEGVSSTTWYADADGDTYGNPAVSQSSCTQPTGYVANSSDCNDGNAAIKPGATELCNGLDDDCDDAIDDGLNLGATCTVGLGACERVGTLICGPGGVPVCSATPGIPSTELCDGLDNDCDGAIDDGLNLGATCTVGLGACERVGTLICGPGGVPICSATPGIPSSELCDGLDNDCDGVIDDGMNLGANCTVGVGACARVGILICGSNGLPVCNATPGAPSTEVCNGIDDDCDGTVDEGFGGVEICNGVDDDCDGLIDEGGVCCSISITSVTVTAETCTGAGNGSLIINASGSGQIAYSINNGVSYQLSAQFNNLSPGTYNVVVLLVGGSSGCSATTTVVLTASTTTAALWYKDQDNDGYSDGITQTACTQPFGYKLASQLTAISGDCNDNNAAQYPGQIWYKDTDNDGYSNGTTQVQCYQPYSHKTAAQLTATSGDCNDANAAIKPGATEICNSIDDDCDALIDEGAAGGLTWTGNVTFQTQAQVNAWSACYSIINGNLLIKNSGITSLTNLVNLLQVTGNVTLENTGLSDFSGLQNLVTIGGNLTIKTHPTSRNLSALAGLQGVMTVGGDLKVYSNAELTTCCAIKDLANETGGHSIGGIVSIYSNACGCDALNPNPPAIPANCSINSSCSSAPLLAPENQPATLDLGEPVQAISDATDAAKLKQSVRLSPNPAQGEVRAFFSPNTAGGSLRLLDLRGSTLFLRTLEPGTEEILLHLGGLPEGLYLVEVHLDGQHLMEKLMIE